MKNVVMAAVAAAVTLCSSISYAQVPAKIQVGAAMPTHKAVMQDASGGEAIPYYKGADKNGLLVMFSCNTCPFVVKNQETTTKAIAHAKANGIGVVIINSNEAKRDGDDSYKAMKDYAAANGYEGTPYLVDEVSKLADAFGATHTPEVFLFDSKKVLVYKGAMNDDPGDPPNAKEQFLVKAIDALAAGKEINPKDTKSIGCSIKRKK